MFYAPDRVEDVFHYQMLTIYSLLITCSISLIRQSITQFHATIAIFIASSPVSIHFLLYSARAYWGKHQLDKVLGKENLLNRRLVFVATIIWISTSIYAWLGPTRRFTQESCFDEFWHITQPMHFYMMMFFLIVPTMKVWEDIQSTEERDIRPRDAQIR